MTLKPGLRLAGVAAALALTVSVPVHAQDPAQSPYDQAIAQAKDSMMADSASALEHARKAATLAASQGNNAEEARLTARWLEGEALMRLNRADEAGRLVGQSLREVEHAAPGSKLHSDLLRSQASLLATQGEYGRALEYFQRAYEYFEALGEQRSEAIVLQNIGSLYSDAREYERVLRYYREADAAFPEDDALALSAHNNTGNALKELDRYAEAKTEFEEALAIAKRMDSPLLEARILTNIASTQYLAGNLSGASRTARDGLAVAEGGAPEWLPFLYGVEGQIAYARGRMGEAEHFLGRTFAGQDLEQTSPYFRDFHETAYLTYRQLGEYRLAMQHLAAFNRLDSQARDLSAKANNALLATRFEAANRELEIARLSADSQAKETQLAQAKSRNILLTTGIALVLMVLAAILLALRAVARSRRAISEANEKLTYVTRHDGLTGLYSRDWFQEQLEDQVARNTASGHHSVLMFIDLDRFKQVNDVFGHRAGDELLKIVAERFRAVIGEGGSIGRLGGDEFAVLLPDAKSVEDAQAIAGRLIDHVSEPCHIDGHEMAVGASVGIAPITGDKSSSQRLMTNADLALYEAKRRGRGVYAIYRPDMREALEERAVLESDLESALKNGEISISYQPIVDADRKVKSYEALMRWNHPERGEISPSVFIPIAEDKLLIDRLGAWMLRSACEEACTWPENVKLALNISTVQLAGGAFLNTVVEALASSGLRADRLVLELTESTVLGLDDHLGQLLDRLREFGVSFALDDFGRGYSSLSYIERISFSNIKIDRDFVHSAASGSKRSEAIVSAITSLAKSLDIDVTAEGIEEESQVDALAALGCTSFQGYHIGRPTGTPVARETARKVA